MKKILGISLCALFAVSAANAEIAATSYVNTINNNLGARITENAGDISDNATAITTINNEIDAMDFTATTEYQYVAGVSQSDGTIEATGASFDTSINEESTDDNAPTSKAVATYVGGAITGVTNNLGALARKNTVGTADIDDSAVATAKIADSAVTEGKLGTGAVTTEKIDAGAVTDVKLANNAVITAKIANNAVTSDKIVDGTITDADIANNAVITAKIATGAVTGDKIFDETIKNNDIAGDAAIDSGKIAFDAIQKAVFASGINSEMVAKITTNESTIQSVKEVADANKEALTPEGDCLTNTDGCTLVYKNGIYSWEAIKR